MSQDSEDTFSLVQQYPAGNGNQQMEDIFSCGEPLCCDLVVPDKQISISGAAVLSTCSMDSANTSDGHTDRNAQFNSVFGSESLECSDTAKEISFKNNISNHLSDSEKCVSNGRVSQVETLCSGDDEDRTSFVPECVKTVGENLCGNEDIGFTREQCRNKDLDTINLSAIQTSANERISELATDAENISSGVWATVDHVTSETKMITNDQFSAVQTAAVHKTIVESQPSSQDILSVVQTASHLSSSINENQKQDITLEVDLLTQDAEFSMDTTVHSNNPSRQATYQDSSGYPLTIEHSSSGYPLTVEHSSSGYPLTVEHSSSGYPLTVEHSSSGYPLTVEHSSSGYPLTVEHSSSGLEAAVVDGDSGITIVAQDNDSVTHTKSFKQKLQIESSLGDSNLDIHTTTQCKEYDIQTTQQSGDSEIVNVSENRDLVTETVSHHNLQNKVQDNDLDLQMTVHFKSDIPTAQHSSDSEYCTSVGHSCLDNQISQTTSNLGEYDTTHGNEAEDQIDTCENSSGMQAPADVTFAVMIDNHGEDSSIVDITQNNCSESSGTPARESSLHVDTHLETTVTAVQTAAHNSTLGIPMAADDCSSGMETVAGGSSCDVHPEMKYTNTRNVTVAEDASSDIQTAVEDTNVGTVTDDRTSEIQTALKDTIMGIETVAQKSDPRIHIAIINNNVTNLADMETNIVHNNSFKSQSAVQGTSLQIKSNFKDGNSKDQSPVKYMNTEFETVLAGSSSEAQTAVMDTKISIVGGSVMDTEVSIIGESVMDTEISISGESVMDTDVRIETLVLESGPALKNSDVTNANTEISNNSLASLSAVQDTSPEIKSYLQEGNCEIQTNEQAEISGVPQSIRVESTEATVHSGRDKIHLENLMVEQESVPQTYSVSNDNSFDIENGLKDDNSDMDITLPNIISEGQDTMKVMNTDILGRVGNGSSGIQPVLQNKDVNIHSDINVGILENDTILKLYEKHDVAKIVQRSELASSISLEVAASTSECSHVDSEVVCSLCVKIHNAAHIPVCEHSDNSLSYVDHFKSTSEDTVPCVLKQLKPTVDSMFSQQGGVDGPLESQPCAQIQKIHSSSVSQEQCSVFDGNKTWGASMGDVNVGMTLDNSVGDVNVGITLDNSVADVNVGMTLVNSVGDVNVGMTLDNSVADVNVGMTLDNSVSDENIDLKDGPMGKQKIYDNETSTGDEKMDVTIDTKLGSFVDEKIHDCASVGDEKIHDGASVGVENIYVKNAFLGREKNDTKLGTFVSGGTIYASFGTCLSEKSDMKDEKGTSIGDGNTDLKDASTGDEKSSSIGDEKSSSVGDEKSNEKSSSIGDGSTDMKDALTGDEKSSSIGDEKSSSIGDETSTSVGDEKFHTSLDASVGQKVGRNEETSEISDKIDTSLGTSTDSEKIDINMGTSVTSEKMDTNFGTSVTSEKMDTNFGKSVSSEKMDTNLSTLVSSDKLDNNLSTSVGSDKLDIDVSTSVGSDKLDNDVSTSVGSDKLDNDVSTSVGGDKIDTNLSTSVGGYKIDTDLSTSVGGDKIDNLSTSVGGDKIDNLSTSVGGDKIDTNLSTSVGGDKIYTNLSKSVGGDKIDNLSTSVGGDKINNNLSTSVDGDKIDNNLSTSVGGDKINDNLSTSVGGDKIDTDLSTSVGGDKIDTDLSIYVSDGDDTNFSIYVSDGDDDPYVYICVSDVDENTCDVPEVDARKLPKLMVVLERCDTSQELLDTHKSETDSSASSTKISQNSERSSDGSPVVNCRLPGGKSKQENGLGKKNIAKRSYKSRKSDNSAQVSKSMTGRNTARKKTTVYKPLTGRNTARKKTTVYKPLTGHNTARKKTTVYAQKFKPLSTCVYFNQNNKKKPSRYFNLRSLDIMRSLRPKTRMDSKNDKTDESYGNTLAQKKNAGTRVKRKPPPESPPLNPTLPFVEVDLDIVVDESQFSFEPIEPALENIHPLSREKKKRGRKKKDYSNTFSAGSNSGSQLFRETAMCDPRHSCCQKTLTVKTDMYTQWEDPSKWYAALGALTSKAMRSNSNIEQTSDSTVGSSIPQMNNLQEDQNYVQIKQEDQNYEQLNHQYLHTDPHQNYEQFKQNDQNYEQLSQQYLHTDPHQNYEQNKQNDQNYEQLSQQYLHTDPHQDFEQIKQEDQSYEQLNQHDLHTYPHQNTLQDIQMAAYAPSGTVISGSGTSAKQGNLLPAIAENISAYQPHVQSSHLLESASSSAAPTLINSIPVHQTPQNLDSSLHPQHNVQLDVHSDSHITHSNNNHLKSRKKSAVKKSSSSTKDSHNAASSHGLGRKRKKTKKTSQTKSGHKRSRKDNVLNDSAVIVIDDGASDSASDLDVVCIE